MEELRESDLGFDRLSELIRPEIRDCLSFAQTPYLFPLVRTTASEKTVDILGKVYGTLYCRSGAVYVQPQKSFTLASESSRSVRIRGDNARIYLQSALFGGSDYIDTHIVYNNQTHPVTRNENPLNDDVVQDVDIDVSNSGSVFVSPRNSRVFFYVDRAHFFPSYEQLRETILDSIIGVDIDVITRRGRLDGPDIGRTKLTRDQLLLMILRGQAGFDPSRLNWENKDHLKAISEMKESKGATPYYAIGMPALGSANVLANHSQSFYVEIQGAGVSDKRTSLRIVYTKPEGRFSQEFLLGEHSSLNALVSRGQFMSQNLTFEYDKAKTSEREFVVLAKDVILDINDGGLATKDGRHQRVIERERRRVQNFVGYLKQENEKLGIEFMGELVPYRTVEELQQEKKLLFDLITKPHDLLK